ncbi:MAG: DNA polymerase III subunit beta [Porticoccaceae bacterium]|jgi:DNA polymerase III subunit beta|nr:DNA polymerase III subunit beta [Porticoccaceae bacterium]
MKFSTDRESLLNALQLVAGVVERRQTLPVLSNVLVVVDSGKLELTGTDLEVEIVARVQGVHVDNAGSSTIPARKWLDIVRSLPEGSDISVHQEAEQVEVVSGRSRFKLSTLPASEFPNVESGQNLVGFKVGRGNLKSMIEKVAFSMAHQDVRYYLNGMLIEHTADHLRMVATDGHRLAMVTSANTGGESDEASQSILPRKGVMELARLLDDSEDEVEISIGSNHFRLISPEMEFTSKLVDGKFPDYQKVVPQGGDKLILSNRQNLKAAFSRASILSNEKYRGVRLQLNQDLLRITANNPEQEQAEEEVGLDYSGGDLEIGFNVSYLIDAMNALEGDDVRVTLSDSNSSALVENPQDETTKYVVMPMRL